MNAFLACNVPPKENVFRIHGIRTMIYSQLILTLKASHLHINKHSLIRNTEAFVVNWLRSNLCRSHLYFYAIVRTAIVSGTVALAPSRTMNPSITFFFGLSIPFYAVQDDSYRFSLKLTMCTAALIFFTLHWLVISSAYNYYFIFLCPQIIISYDDISNSSFFRLLIK